GNEKPITCRPANLLKPILGKIPDEAEPYILSEEDRITYALFPSAALEFFKKRKTQPEGGVPSRSFERLGDLKEVAALSVAIATFLRHGQKTRALIPTRRKEILSPWVLAGRQNQSERGA
ncbi:MAG: hypothetical protein JSV58_03955, partial [Candidatus Bathyarchaeota archaeon]